MLAIGNLSGDQHKRAELAHRAGERKAEAREHRREQRRSTTVLKVRMGFAPSVAARLEWPSRTRRTGWTERTEKGTVTKSSASTPDPRERFTCTGLLVP